MLHRLYAINYHPCSEASEGYVFTGICLSKSEGGGVGDTHGTRLECLPLPPTPPGPGQNVYPPGTRLESLPLPPPSPGTRSECLPPLDQVRMSTPLGPGQNVYPFPPGPGQNIYPPHLRLGQNVYPLTWDLVRMSTPLHLRLGQNVYPPPTWGLVRMSTPLLELHAGGWYTSYWNAFLLNV